MTNEADYELWAAMMADDEPVATLAKEVFQEDLPAIQVPIIELNVIPAVEPETQDSIVSEETIEPIPLVPDEPENMPETEVEEFVLNEDTLGFSDLAKSTISEIPVRSFEFRPATDDPASDEALDFPTNLFKEPQTNSIQIAEIPDALDTDIVTDSGEVLKTGAIDIPLMGNTGSIPIITAVPETIDEVAINADMGDETTGGIPPIRARSVMNSTAQVAVLPIKNRRSEGQTILLATTSILLVTLGAAVLALYMLEIIR